MQTLIPSGFVGEMEIYIPEEQQRIIKENPVAGQLYITHIGYYPNARNHFRKRPKGAEQYIFIYCENGKGWVEYKDNRFALSKNQYIILPPNEKHSYGSDGKNPWNIYWFHFKGYNASFFDSIIGKRIEIPEADNSRFQDRFLLFAEIYRNLEQDQNIEQLEYTSFCLMHFLASLKYLVSYRNIKSIKEADCIQKCIQYMKDHLEKEIFLKDIADAGGYSQGHINTVFHRETHCSPMKYLAKLRIQRACTYLRTSDLKIKEIALRLHYYDQFHFSKAFAKEMNMTPKEYRYAENDAKIRRSSTE